MKTKYLNNNFIFVLSVLSKGDEDINPLVVKFLLDNELIFLEELNSTIHYKELAIKKLDIAKARKDSKAIQDYEKIIELLKHRAFKAIKLRNELYKQYEQIKYAYFD